MSSKTTKSVRKSLLDKIDLKKPIHTGWMFKQSPKPPKNFNKRFFALYDKVLVYYDTDTHYARDVAKGTFEHRQKALLLDHLYLSKPDKKPHGAKFCFILHAPNTHNERHELLLVTETREQRREWMAKLQEQNPDLLESSHRHHHHRGGSTTSTTSTASSNSLTVPGSDSTTREYIRADSATPEAMEAIKEFQEKRGIKAEVETAEEVQTIDVQEAASDEEK